MKRLFKVILFGGVVAIMGLMIRGCNREFGWYEANKVELEVEKPLQESKLRWYLAEEFNRGDMGELIMPFTYAQLLYDTALVKPFPRIEYENNFVLVYDSTWVFPFVHTKYRAHTQHTYQFHIYLEDSVPFANVEIHGPYNEYFDGRFFSLSDSLSYLPYNAPSYDEEIEDVVKEETKEEISHETDDSSSTTTDHEAR